MNFLSRSSRFFRRRVARLATFAAFLILPVLSWATPNFTPQGGIVLSSGTPQSIVMSTSTTFYRLYFLRDVFSVLSATSTDGATWSVESGVRLSTFTAPLINASSFAITGCSVLPLAAGGYGMLYSAQISTGEWRVMAATSSDGLGWANQATPVIDSLGTFVGSPKLIKLVTGAWRLYYTADSNGGNDAADRQVFSTMSSDEGVTWTNPTSALAQQVGEIGAVIRTDNRVRVFLTQPLSGETTYSVLLSALSTASDGATLSLEAGTRLSIASTSGGISYPLVFRSTETFRWRLLYGFTVAGSTWANILTGLTLDPDPQFLNPSQVTRSAPAGSFTISGEVFGSTPTVTLMRTGESDIVGTGVTRAGDTSVSATFDTNSRALGQWNLLVVNPDGHATVLVSALFITFQSGDVTLTDNLLRPRTGARTRFDIVTFDDGNVSIDIFTLDGKMVDSVYNAMTPSGTLTQFWDGRTAEGNAAASGTYLVRVRGPKLDVIKKIVVIR